MANFNPDIGPHTVYANVSGENFTIYEQNVITNSDWYKEYVFKTSCDRFSNDSVYVEYSFVNSFGEPFSGKGYRVWVN